MTMLKRILILGALVTMVPTMSVAQPDPQRQRGEEACGGDARRFCRKVLDQGDMTVLQCLQTNEKKLSKSCRKMLEDNGQL